MHDGRFVIDGEDKRGTSTVTRKGKRQVEEVAYMGLVVRYKVTWTGDCSYTLSGRKVMKGEDPFPHNATDSLFARIVSVSDEEVHVELRSNFASLKDRCVMRRVKP